MDMKEMKMYKPEEIAEIMQVDLETVVMWLRQRRLIGIKVGTIWRITEQQFDKFLQVHSSHDEVCEGGGGLSMKDEQLLNLEQSDLLKPTRKYNRRAGKYDEFQKCLNQLKIASVSFSFDEVEEIIGFELPNSAYKYAAWWGNDCSHSQARAWMQAGWEVSRVDLDKREVQLIRK